MEGEATLTAVEVFVGLVTAAGLIAMLARRAAIPYTVALVVAGLAAAIFVPGGSVAISEDLVLLVLLPGLIFEAAYNLDIGELRRAFGGVTLLAVPGVLVTTLVVAGVLALTTDIPLELGFVLGAMVAATDPAAVIATFRRLGSPRRLSTMVEGESLFNDATALVIFVIAMQFVTASATIADGVRIFVLTLIVSAAVGGTVGFVASRLIARVDDHLIELTISVAAAYGSYLIADLMHESGVFATVVAGMVLGNYGRRIGMSERTQEALNTVWEFIGFLLTALVFLLVGLVISVPALFDAIGPIAWGIVAVMVGRVIVVYLLLGGTSYLISDRYHPAIPLPWLHVMFWAGLRGAVAVAMALSLPPDFPQRQLLQEVTFGIVLFTLVVQGTTIGLLIERTGAGSISEPRTVESRRAKQEEASDLTP